MRLRPQTRNARSTRRPGRLLQASKYDESGRETRPQLRVRQRRGRLTPEGRWTYPRTMDPVVLHSCQRQVTEARPKHRRELGQWPENMPLGEAGADRHHPLFGERKDCRTDRTESPLSCSRSPSTMIPPCARDCLFGFGGGRGAAAVKICHHHG